MAKDPTPQDGSSEVRELAKAVEGLEYPSESDAPFDPFRWPGKSGGGTAQEQVTARAGKGRKVTEVPVDRFFAELRGADDADRFWQLLRLLDSQLTDLKVLRAGEGESKVDVYLIGKARSGDWIGLHTTSVET